MDRCFFPFFFLVVTLSLAADASGAAVDRAEVGAVTVELWCVAKNNAEDPVLQQALNWACGQGGAACGPIQQDGACFFSDDLQTMASYAFNDYYLKHGLTDDSCNFGNAAALTSINPSKGKCKFPSSLTVNKGSFSAASTTVGSGQASADLSGCSSITDQWLRFLLISHVIILITWIFG